MALKAGYFGIKKSMLQLIESLSAAKVIKSIGSGLNLSNAGELSCKNATSTVKGVVMLDSEPTEGSGHAVSSGGVYAALQNAGGGGVYSAGDAITEGSLMCYGILTSSSKTLTCFLPVLVDDTVDSISLSEITARGGNGYLQLGSGGSSINHLALENNMTIGNFSLVGSKNAKILQFDITPVNSAIAFAGPNNNTPVIVTLWSTITFNAAT